MQNPEFARHLTNRLGYGPRPGDLAAIAKLGADPWIEQQLHPVSLAVPQELSARLSTLETLSLSPAEAFMQFGPQTLKAAKDDPEKRKEVQQQARLLPAEAIEARILRAVYSPRQLEETLVDFWFNHFNVFVGKGLDRVWISAYERDAIRPNVLGRFRDLLGATAKHPAMLFYLDNWQNSAPGNADTRGRFNGLNENYARELMELHTLGVDGGYTQADVIALAKILTGWGLGGPGGGQDGAQRATARRAGRGRRGGFVFADNRHDFSDKIFLGRKIPSSGEHEGEIALDMLARHPATARHISFKLAQFYLADAPDPQVVAQMAATFTKTDGHIGATLKTLFASSAFRDPAAFGTRFKTPLRYVISVVRASGVEVRNFRPIFGTLTQLGQPLYGCQTPDGYKCTESAWLNADAMTRRVTFAIALASGRLPLAQMPDDMPRLGAQGLPPQSLAARENAARGLNARRPERAAEHMPLPNANAPQVAPSVDVNALIATLGGQLSDQTKAVIATATPELRAALVLGSPDFMRC